MITSAQISESMTYCISSAMTHFPGVLFQQQKQPLHPAILLFATIISLISASPIPSRKALVSRIVLLPDPLGLPLITSTFMYSVLQFRDAFFTPDIQHLHIFFAKRYGHIPVCGFIRFFLNHMSIFVY